MAAPKILCDTAGMDRRTWLAARAHGPDGSIPITIGGSDVAAIFGISRGKRRSTCGLKSPVSSCRMRAKICGRRKWGICWSLL